MTSILFVLPTLILGRINLMHWRTPSVKFHSASHPQAGLSTLASVRLMQPDVPVTIAASDDVQMANCSDGVVAGLDPTGDGFLAVRSGPGTSYRMLDRLHNGEGVLLCYQPGDWVGIVYGGGGEYGGNGCNVEGAEPERPYNGPCRSGWAHGRWIKFVAG